MVAIKCLCDTGVKMVSNNNVCPYCNNEVDYCEECGMGYFEIDGVGAYIKQAKEQHLKIGNDFNGINKSYDDR